MNLRGPEIVASLLALIFSVIVHECAHGLVALWKGDPTARDAGRLTLNPIPHIDLWGSVLLPAMLLASGSGFLFGWAKPVPVNVARLRDPERDGLYVSLAGPLSNLLLALIASVLLGFSRGLIEATGLETGVAFRIWGSFLLSAVVINVVLGLFNLLPIPPLDGGWILSALLPPELRAGYERIRPFGMLLLIVLLFTGSLGILWRAASWVIGLYLGLGDLLASGF